MQAINRRDFVTQLGVGTTAAAATLLAQHALAAEPGPAPTQKIYSHETCLENCRNCEQICKETITYCLAQGGAHTHAEHIAKLLACAEICRTSAAFMTYKSALSGQVCGVCAEVCQTCADSCAKIDDTSAQMKTCIVACNTCVKSCRQMASGMHHHE